MIPRREIFGDPACPLLYRWHLLDLGDRGKIMLHWFLPEQSERDFHDHPRSFLTLVLWGSYRDVSLDGVVDHVVAPTARFRPAEHAHVTQAGPRGCLTLCLLGRRRRSWGFWRDGKHWLPWQRYVSLFGDRFRCE